MKFFNKLKIFFYRRFLSNAKTVEGNPIIKQPTLFLGRGRIILGEKLTLGYFPSPYFYSGYIHIEARDKNSSIQIGSGIISNNFVAIAYGASIKIGDKCLIGHNVEIINSDFHNINPANRWGGDEKPLSKDIVIGNNVWLGNSCKILKGVTIGDNSVVAAGAIVTKDVPPNTIVAGNPAREIQKI